MGRQGKQVCQSDHQDIYWMDIQLEIYIHIYRIIVAFKTLQNKLKVKIAVYNEINGKD